MKKKLAIIGMLLLIAIPAFSIKSGGLKIKIGDPRSLIVDENKSTKTPYSAATGSFFDKSANGYGWYLGFNRKVAWNSDPLTGDMVGAVYRKLNPATGSGTVGGTVGEWTGSDLNFYSQVVMGASPNWTEPGGRYPHTSGFINGYLFASYADINYSGGSMNGGFPMFAVGNATWGYDFTSWDFGNVTATDGGATVQDCLSGTGDVVYDPGSGYYYWSQTWDVGDNIDDIIKPCVVGRTTTPSVASSWEWSDYNDMIFDCSDDASGLTQSYSFQYAYCKDRQGYGTGYGIAVTVASDVDNYVMLMDSVWTEVDSTTVPPDSAWVVSSSRADLNPKISYMYTTNWGGDDSTGDWASNWITNGDKLFTLDTKDLFDWYGSTLTEIDSATNDTIVTIMNDPFVTWNISAVATEYNYVHLLIKAFGGTYEGDQVGYLLDVNDDDFVAGYYHVRGLITDTGIVWSPAHFIASMVGLDTGDIEWGASNRNTLSIGYAGFGQLYATWLDRPVNRPTTTEDFAAPESEYFDDGFMSFSCNDGDDWEIPAGGHIEVEFPEEPGHIYNLYYAQNVTGTGTLHEEGWTCSATGKIVDGNVEVYMASQYYDVANPLDPPVESFFDYQQFLHLWKVTGAISDTTGISAEPVDLDMDYELMQNYPNPFNPSTEISFKIQNDANVKLNVFNSNGETVVSLVDGKMAKGLHKVNFDATKLNSGVYFYQLDVNGMTQTKKMVLAK